MPIYRSFDWKDFRIEVKPLGIRKYIRFWPYFTRSELKFRLSIRTLSKKKHKTYSRFMIHAPHGISHEINIMTQPDRPVSYCDCDYSRHKLEIPGYHFVAFLLRWENSEAHEWSKHVLAFTVYSKANVVWALLLILLTIILTLLAEHYLLPLLHIS